jgi:hypothetical protein
MEQDPEEPQKTLSNDNKTSKFFSYRQKTQNKSDVKENTKERTPIRSPFTQASSNIDESITEGSENDIEHRSLSNSSSETNYRQIMIDRWEKSNKLTIPVTDLKEIED